MAFNTSDPTGDTYVCSWCTPFPPTLTPNPSPPLAHSDVDGKSTLVQLISKPLTEQILNKFASRWAHDAIITVIVTPKTSQHRFDVIITLLVRYVSVGLHPEGPVNHKPTSKFNFLSSILLGKPNTAQWCNQHWSRAQRAILLVLWQHVYLTPPLNNGEVHLIHYMIRYGNWDRHIFIMTSEGHARKRFLRYWLLALCEGNHWPFPIQSHAVTRGLVFSLTLAWTNWNCWTNSRVPRDLRRHDTHMTSL